MVENFSIKTVELGALKSVCSHNATQNYIVTIFCQSKPATKFHAKIPANYLLSIDYAIFKSSKHDSDEKAKKQLNCHQLQHP